MDFNAVILAAGLSSRMGRPKPLLPLGSSTVIQRVIDSFNLPEIGTIIVVLGHESDHILNLLSEHPVRTVINHRYKEGMFSSIVAGVSFIDNSKPSGTYIMPVDYPLVRGATLIKLAREFVRCGKGIIHPCFRGKRGHPPLISSKYYNGIKSWNGSDGLKGFLSHFEWDSSNLEVNDEGILLDMDTPEDYEKVIIFERSGKHQGWP